MSPERRAPDLADVRSEHADERQRRTGRERGYRRAVQVGLGLSVVVHLLLLFVLGRGLRVPEMGYEPIRLPVSERAPGLRLVRVVPPPSPPSEAAPPPRRRRPISEQTEEPAAEETPAAEQGGEEPTREEGEPGEEAERVTNAERLRPREGDARLWREFWDEDLGRRYFGETARADSAIRAILGRYLDSLQLTDEELAKAKDWTFTEGDERWGISPEGIHLGNITIPLPVDRVLQPTGPRRRELERELRELREIRRQETILQAQDVREERIKAMRERSRERAEQSRAEEDSAAADSTASDG